MPSSPDIPWDRDELVLVLDLYRLTKGPTPPADAVARLSRTLRARRERIDGTAPEPKVRSTAGISAKLGAFEALKQKTGTTRGSSALVTEVWDDLGHDSKRAWDAAWAIKKTLPKEERPG